MGERSRSREMVDRLAGEVKKHYDQHPTKRMTSQQAHEFVASAARLRDRERAGGDAKNKRKGVESGKRRARAEAESRGAAADRRKTIHRMRSTTFVDLGKKG